MSIHFLALVVSGFIISMMMSAGGPLVLLPVVPLLAAYVLGPVNIDLLAATYHPVHSK